MIFFVDQVVIDNFIFFSEPNDNEDLQMPRLCPISEVVPETNVYNNPPVLTKKPESENLEEASDTKEDTPSEGHEKAVEEIEKCDGNVESENLSSSPAEKFEDNTQVRFFCSFRK